MFGDTHITVTPVLQARIGWIFLLYFILDEVWELSRQNDEKVMSGLYLIW